MTNLVTKRGGFLRRIGGGKAKTLPRGRSGETRIVPPETKVSVLPRPNFRSATDKQIAYLRRLAGGVSVFRDGRDVPLDHSLGKDAASDLIDYLRSRRIPPPATDRQLAALRKLVKNDSATVGGRVVPINRNSLNVREASQLIDYILFFKHQVWNEPYVRNADLPVPNPSAGDNPLKGEVVVFTGVLPNGVKRTAAYEAVAAAGGQPKQNVTRLTTMLVVGEWLPYTLLPDRPHSGKFAKVMEMRKKDPGAVKVIDGDLFIEYAAESAAV